MRDGWPLSEERSCAVAGFKLGDVPALVVVRSRVKEERLSSQGLYDSQSKNSPSCEGERTRMFFLALKRAFWVCKKVTKNRKE